MRRMIGGIAVVGAMGLGLAACGGSTPPKTTTTAPSTTTTTTTTPTSTAGTTAALSPACQKVEGILAKINAKLPSAASNPQKLATSIQGYATQLQSAVASGSSALKTEVGAFITELQAAGKGNIQIAKLEGTAAKIGQTCGSGSTTSTT